MRSSLLRILLLAAIFFSSTSFSSPPPPAPPPPPEPLSLDLPEAEGPEGREYRPVDLAQLNQVFEQADRLEVLSLSPAGDEWRIYQTSDPKDVAQLKAALRLDPEGGGFRDMCAGQPAIRLYKEGKSIARLSFHHGSAIRFDQWDSDVPITDPEPLLRWFDERGISGPRKEVEESRAQAAKDEEAEKRWVDAMPESLRPFWEAMRNESGLGAEEVDPTKLREALTKALPGQEQQLGALFEWFGSGAGPWSGFPAYEGAAEEILLTYSTPELLAVAEREGLTESQLEGAARLFGGWPFGQARGKDLALLSKPLRVRLLAQALRSEDDDKQKRARNAFAEEP